MHSYPIRQPPYCMRSDRLLRRSIYVSKLELCGHPKQGIDVRGHGYTDTGFSMPSLALVDFFLEQWSSVCHPQYINGPFCWHVPCPSCIAKHSNFNVPVPCDLLGNTNTPWTMYASYNYAIDTANVPCREILSTPPLKHILRLHIYWQPVLQCIYRYRNPQSKRQTAPTNPLPQCTNLLPE